MFPSPVVITISFHFLFIVFTVDSNVELEAEFKSRRILNARDEHRNGCGRVGGGSMAAQFRDN
jgi:hypothetical protein